MDDNSNGIFCENENKFGKTINQKNNQVAYTINYAPIKRHSMLSHFKSLAVLSAVPASANCVLE